MITGETDQNCGTGGYNRRWIVCSTGNSAHHDPRRYANRRARFCTPRKIPWRPCAGTMTTRATGWWRAI